MATAYKIRASPAPTGAGDRRLSEAGRQRGSARTTERTLMRPIQDSDKAPARAWYEEHRAHVDRMCTAYAGPAYPPSGSDCIRPELWKPAHWKWLLEEPAPGTMGTAYR